MPGSFAVQLDVTTSDGTRSGFAEARVSRTRAIRDDSPRPGCGPNFTNMVKQMMTDMNVEFEYQIRRSLRDYLQATAPAAPEAGGGGQRTLSPPNGAPAAAARPPGGTRAGRRFRSPAPPPDRPH